MLFTLYFLASVLVFLVNYYFKKSNYRIIIARISMFLFVLSSILVFIITTNICG